MEFFVLDEPLAHLFDPKCDSSIEKKILNASNPLDQVFISVFGFKCKKKGDKSSAICYI